jgi:hypothetical protein
MKKSLLSILILLALTFSSTAQPREDYDYEYNFKFYSKNGKLITSQNNYTIKAFSYKNNLRNEIQLNFLDNYYTRVCYGDKIELEIIHKRDTMKIFTNTSIDSIPFIKGSFTIPKSYASIFSIIPLNHTKINQLDFQKFRSDNSTIEADTLQTIECHFWEDSLFSKPLEHPNQLFYLFNDATFSNNLFISDYKTVYISKDFGKNWYIFKSVNPDEYIIPKAFYIDSTTLYYTRYDAGPKPYGGIPDIFISKDNGKTWKYENSVTRYDMKYDFMGEEYFNKQMKLIKKFQLEENQSSNHTLTRKRRILNSYKPILVINNDWNVYETSSQTINIVSGNFTLISKNNGKTWDYYTTPTGSNIFEIIQDTYIFNGYNLYVIPNK